VYASAVPPSASGRFNGIRWSLLKIAYAIIQQLTLILHLCSVLKKREQMRSQMKSNRLFI
jgi:hypothetical protein